jgi:hypothetical protein
MESVGSKRKLKGDLSIGALSAAGAQPGRRRADSHGGKKKLRRRPGAPELHSRRQERQEEAAAAGRGAQMLPRWTAARRPAERGVCDTGNLGEACEFAGHIGYANPYYCPASSACNFIIVVIFSERKRKFTCSITSSTVTEMANSVMQCRSHQLALSSNRPAWILTCSLITFRTEFNHIVISYWASQQPSNRTNHKETVSRPLQIREMLLRISGLQPINVKFACTEQQLDTFTGDKRLSPFVDE